jgi:hypothetical protein
MSRLLWQPSLVRSYKLVVCSVPVATEPFAVGWNLEACAVADKPATAIEGHRCSDEIIFLSSLMRMRNKPYQKNDQREREKVLDWLVPSLINLLRQRRITSHGYKAIFSTPSS